jgi:hypothetical protein
MEKLKFVSYVFSQTIISHLCSVMLKYPASILLTKGNHNNEIISSSRITILTSDIGNDNVRFKIKMQTLKI